MTFRWGYTPSAGPAVTFEDQTEAEDWLGANWSSLRDSGIDEVTLYEDDTELYRMSLHAE